jgi:hypothetical protein
LHTAERQGANPDKHRPFTRGNGGKGFVIEVLTRIESHHFDRRTAKQLFD